MSTLPRTPVHFPRMKVRGKRNRAKLAARYYDRRHMPHVRVGFDPATGSTSFWATSPEDATHAIVVELATRDGYGRVVPKPAPRPKPKPKPSYSMTMQFKAESGPALAALFDTLTGRGGG